MIKLIHSYKYDENIYNLSIKTFSYLEISFSKYVDLNMMLKVSHALDSVIHMFSFTKGRSRELTIYDVQKNSYELFCLQYKDKEENEPIYCLNKRENNVNNFAKLFELFINVNENDDNSFFPFLNFDRKVVSVEIQFLEYYRALEFTDTEMRRKIGMDKNRQFLLEILSKYPNLKRYYFGIQENEEVEKEIRSLRNYYSHFGYYIKKLPIPTEKPERYKEIDIQWIYNVKKFVKIAAYLEVYELSGIVVNEQQIINYLK